MLPYLPKEISYNARESIRSEQNTAYCQRSLEHRKPSQAIEFHMLGLHFATECNWCSFPCVLETDGKHTGTAPQKGKASIKAMAKHLN